MKLFYLNPWLFQKGGRRMEKDDTSQTKEICDIYDVYGNRTGKTFVRGEPLSNGQ